MSKLIDLDPPNCEEQDEIDALNDETFGCDLADINDDWEGQHDKLTGFDGSLGGHISGKREESKHSQRVASLSSNIENFLNLGHSSKITATNQLVDDVLPHTEDIIKKSISNFILDDDLYDDDDDICPDFASYELEAQNELANSKTNSKIDAKTINLESLRPPSPSILPFDDPFMSSVWRPLSPELNAQQRQHQRSATPNESHFIESKSNDSKFLTLEEIERSLTLNGHNDSVSSNNNVSKTKAIRLEDLEAQFLEPIKPKHEMAPLSASINSFMNASTSQAPNTTTQVPAFPPGKMPPNIMDIAAMSLTKLSLQPQPPTIPSASKIVPPPPGLGPGSKFNLPGTTSIVTQPSVPIPQNFLSKMPTTKGPESLQSQMAMANAMVNALANLSQLPTARPQLSMMPGDVKLSPANAPMVLDPLVQQEQQRLINRIITPAQAQRFYPSHFNNFSNGRNQDKFAGFMTQKEKDWLVKIFRLQCKVNDPYVEDYYEVNFRLKKANLERRQNLAKQHNKNVDDLEIESLIESQTLIVLPELAKVEDDKPKYIQFDNALGKIQVLNTKSPRKLLDVNPDKPLPSNMDSYSSFLIKIERLYEHLLNIEDEDKRMPILPERAIPFHIEKRGQLCQMLFNGLVKPVTTPHKDEGTFFILVNRNIPTLKRLDTEVDPEILHINKGLLLVYRSLFKFRDESQLVVLLSSLLKGSNYKKFVLEAERISQTSYANMLIKALGRIEQTRNLIYIAASMDDLDVITQNKQYGHRFLVAIFKQYQTSNDKLLFIYFWKLFVQAVMEKVATYPELRQLCKDHFQYLTEL